jgi:hypothetical protein
MQVAHRASTRLQCYDQFNHALSAPKNLHATWEAAATAASGVAATKSTSANSA